MTHRWSYYTVPPRQGLSGIRSCLQYYANTACYCLEEGGWMIEWTMITNCLTSCPASLQEFGQESKTKTIGFDFQYENTICIYFQLSSYVNPTVLRKNNLIFIISPRKPPVTHSKILWTDAVDRLGGWSCPSVMWATSVKQGYVPAKRKS